MTRLGALLDRAAPRGSLEDQSEQFAGKIRVLFCCIGIGIVSRGFESFFREAFDGLKGTEGLDARLIKGKGARKEDEWVAGALPRTGWLAPMLGRLVRRNGYVIEQWSGFPGLVRRIRQFRPHVVFYSEPNLGFLLYWFRHLIGVRYRLLFSNGGPLSPPFVRTDFVHQVAPSYLAQALNFGEPADRHFLVPYGIDVGALPATSAEQRQGIRRRLGLPLNRTVVLSVGWIARRHKRMDYVIEEVARLPGPRPYLQLLGAMDEDSPQIVALGKSLLGPDGFGAASAPYEEVSDYYRAADIFVLASLNEGFGRVYLEALAHGLPVIAHRYAVTEYILGCEALLADLSQPTTLARAISEILPVRSDPAAAEQRWRTVRDRFSWQVLAPLYLRMFEKVAGVCPADPATQNQSSSC